MVNKPEWWEGEFNILWLDFQSQIKSHRKVHGYIYGPFGVHQTGPHGFSITHIPTERQVAFEDSLEKVRDIAEALVQVNIDWTQTSTDYYRGLPKDARNEIDRARRWKLEEALER